MRIYSTQRHETIEHDALGVVETQAEFRAPPQHVVGGPRPFLVHQVVHLDGSEIGAEAQAEVCRLLRGLEHGVDARAIGRREAARGKKAASWHRTSSASRR